MSEDAQSQSVSSFSSTLGAEDDVKVLNVANGTGTKALAESIMAEIRKGLDARPAKLPLLTLHAIGHQAIGQAVKAVPVANDQLASKGLMLLILPTFFEKMIPLAQTEWKTEEDKTKEHKMTVMRLRLHYLRLGA